MSDKITKLKTMMEDLTPEELKELNIIKFVETKTIDTQGRLYIPMRYREMLGIKPGTTVGMYENDGKLVVYPTDFAEDKKTNEKEN